MKKSPSSCFTSDPPNPLPQSANRAAFTLIELLTVIAIIAILASILIPVVGRVRDGARTAKCTTNQRQIATAVILYAEDHGGAIPFGRDTPTPGVPGGVYPLIIGEYLPGRYQGTGIPLAGGNSEVFYCPNQDPHHGQTDYGVNDFIMLTNVSGPSGNSQRSPQLTWIDEPSRTPMIADAQFAGAGGQIFGSWQLHVAKFLATPDDRSGSFPGPRHGGASLNVAFFDGHVERITFEDLKEHRHELFRLDFRSGQ